SRNWAWRSCRSRRTWPTRWRRRCVITTCRNGQLNKAPLPCTRGEGRKGRMITRITGVLNRVLDEEVRLQVGAFEDKVLVPEFVRREVQGRLGLELTLHTCEYLDGNPMQGKVVPRLIGFISEAELEFFELFCTVDKVGTRKALKALVRPVREI